MNLPNTRNAQQANSPQISATVASVIAVTAPPRRKLSARNFKLMQWLFVISLLVVAWTAHAAPTYTLQQVIDNANLLNPSINISRAEQDRAVAGVTIATAYINPEVEVGAGPSRYRANPNEVKNNWGVGLSQPLEYPWVRSARREWAESSVKDTFYDVLQRQAILKIVEEDRNLLQQIRDRIKLRVDVGEAPRYELIRADTELMAAERDYQAALVRITEAKAYLRGLVGPSMGNEFELLGELPLSNTLPNIDELKARVEQTPQLQQIRLAIEAAEAKVRLEQRLRNPGLTLKAGVEQDPDLTSLRLGVALPIPIWNQRQGQIAEASAGLRQVQAMASDRQLGLNRDLEAAYQRYLIAQQQVYSFESGLLSQSEAVLKTAEAAYRFGERGILEYLDAQRTFRIVRRDYITARYDYVSAMLQIERLLGTELLPTT